jgi:branched-chain amino acid transport system permease protein
MISAQIAPTQQDARSAFTSLSRATLLVLCIGGAGFLPLLFASSLTLSLILQALIDALFAVSVGFLIRQNGRISFGHAGFFGTAAYLCALLFKNTSLPPELSIGIALLVPTAIAFLLGLVIARIPGIAHAMITLAVGQAMYEVAFKWRAVTNGDDGLSASLPREIFGLGSSLFQSPQSMFVVCWIATLVVIVGLIVLVRSPFGQLTEAIKENPERARFVGYETAFPRAVIYAISGFIASVAGVLFFLYNGFVSPGLLHWSTSGSGLIMAIIGGSGLVWAPAVGGMIYFAIKEVAGDATELWPAIVGGILIMVTLFIPQGLGALLASGPARIRQGMRR